MFRTFLQNTLVALLLAVVVLGATFGFGYYMGHEQRNPEFEIATLTGKSPDDSIKVDFAPFWRTWKTIGEKYVPTGSTSTPRFVSDQDKVWGAIAGLTKSLGDPYSVFFKPDLAKIFASEISGTFEGVGMEIGIRDNVLTVIAPLKDTPSYRAGIKSGDKIIKIEGKTTEDLSVDEAVRLIRGSKETKVRLTIFRDKQGELPEFVLTRERINIPTLEVTTAKNKKTARGASHTVGTGSDIRDDGVFVIRLFNFGATSAELFKNALQKFVDSGSRKLILDLRGNPGGYLEAAVEMGSWFLPKGTLIVRESFGEKERDIMHQSLGYDIFHKLNRNPSMLILVDRGSASASEILAGALREHGIAQLIGERTFGKGSVQELIQLDGGASLKLTIARWFTPHGVSISNGGLKPDIEIVPTEEDIKAKHDVAFERAVDLLTDLNATSSPQKVLY